MQPTPSHRIKIQKKLIVRFIVLLLVYTVLRTKNKEDLIMKKNDRMTHRARQLYIYKPAYPNAPQPSYFTDRMLNALTVVVSAMGFVTTVICLVAMA